MGAFQTGSIGSAWKSYVKSRAAPGLEPWGDAKPALIGLGTRAAPVMEKNRDAFAPDRTDQDWKELEEFEEQVRGAAC